MTTPKRAYSKLTRDALTLLGAQIKLARKERRMSEIELAERIGIARSTLQKIEKGEPQVDIGFVFEAAVLVGQPLFEPEGRSLAALLERTRDKIALMPGKIRKPKSEVNDDF